MGIYPSREVRQLVVVAATQSAVPNKLAFISQVATVCRALSLAKMNSRQNSQKQEQVPDVLCDPFHLIQFLNPDSNTLAPLSSPVFPILLHGEV